MKVDAEQDSDWEEYVKQRACQLFTYRCPVEVGALKKTEDPKVRICDTCQEAVHFCDSESELAHHAALGHCAAIAVRIPRQKDDQLPIFIGMPRMPRCVLCNSASDVCRLDSECGVFEDPGSPDIIHFDSLELENEAFRAFSHRWVHAKCMLKWKYRDRFMEAWNRALQERFINKRLFVSSKGGLRYTDPLTWVCSDAEADRKARQEWERAESAKAAKARDQDKAARAAMLVQRCGEARRKAIAMGIATEENVNRILHNMPLEDFMRDFDALGVSRGFFS